MKDTKRKSFPIFRSWGKNVDKLSTEEKALLLDKLFDFYYGDDTIEIPNEMVRLDMFWDSINQFMIENEDKYQLTSGKRSDNISKARQSNPKCQPNKNNDTRPAVMNISTKQVSNVNANANANENDNVKDNVKDNVNDNVKNNVDVISGNGILNSIGETVEYFKNQLTNGISIGKLNTQYPQSSSLKEAYDEYRINQ